MITTRYYIIKDYFNCLYNVDPNLISVAYIYSRANLTDIADEINYIFEEVSEKDSMKIIKEFKNLYEMVKRRDYLGGNT